MILSHLSHFVNQLFHVNVIQRLIAVKLNRKYKSILENHWMTGPYAALNEHDYEYVP